jgi:5-formyltetrahydrofolate cyclo-ligase
MGKRCFLPILHPLKKNSLWFVEYTPDTRLKPNRFGILEPIRAGETLVPAWSLDLVLMPVVAFDHAANRLGMGLGYYDTTFGMLKNQTNPFSPPILLGLAYEFQCLSKLPTDSWDVSLAGVITEKRILFTGYTSHRMHIPTFKEL